MTEEEKKAAEAKALADAEAAKALADGQGVEPDPLAIKDEEITKLKEERDNYKAVALKRLGKLPGDVDFLGGNSELTVAEQVKLILLDKEIDAAEKAKQDETKRLIKEVSELKLALKNRPENSIGGGDGATVEVKDNVLSASQIVELKAKALKLKVDPEKFIENFKKNLRARQ